jgi:trehalose-phosphatase
MNSPALERFWATLADAAARALLLDYDGTLAPFRVDRDRAWPYPGVRESLSTITKAGHTRVVLVSGRPARDLAPLLRLDPMPEVWGSHGAERLCPDGSYIVDEADERAAKAIASALNWAYKQRLGNSLEVKPGSLALHWRGLSPEEAERLRKLVEPAWLEFADGVHLALREFDGGLELRSLGHTKADVVCTILQEEGCDAAVAYLGDDTTDEDAFRAICDEGLGVLVRDEPRDTLAAVWLRPPDGLLAFLSRWHDVASGRLKPQEGET